MEQIKQLKVMRGDAQKRLEQKREVIKKQMYALATSADAKLIKSLNPLIENLEKTLAKNIEAKNIEAKVLEAKIIEENMLELPNYGAQAVEFSNITISNVLPLHPRNDVDKTAEDALAKALNAVTPNIEKKAPAPIPAPIQEIILAPVEVAIDAEALVIPTAIAPTTISVPLTPAQRTQSELEKIAAQLRENISQNRTI
ncbi:MAG: hypothetical protein COC17_07870 [Hyphomicrobiales bacterium]|nr:hypothetical protein [Hyphomicrobiales bacterium]PCH49638.1 MAG: hypothetical protein COC17_07870 [Hyphomicrobiales bacterium]